MKHQHSFIHLWLNLQKETSIAAMAILTWSQRLGQVLPTNLLGAQHGHNEVCAARTKSASKSGLEVCAAEVSKMRNDQLLVTCVGRKVSCWPKFFVELIPNISWINNQESSRTNEEKIEHNKNWHWFEPLRKGEKVKTVVFFNTPLTIGPCDVFSFL